MKHTVTTVLVLGLSLTATKISAQQFNISPPIVTEIASGFFQQQFTFAEKK
jgi:hypothetical protein